MPPLLDRIELAERICALSKETWTDRPPTMLIGRHRALEDALEKLLYFAQADSPVLITGETGTGKELFARALYLLSARRRRPYLSVNCAQYADGQLIASELFGHKRGSFTGAINDHKGVFEAADGGVVFLDEIGELSATPQAMLLRALSEGEIVPVGETRARPVSVRVIAATSRDLKQLVAAGQFRPDLYYRLRFLHVRVPALRERADDIDLIARHFVHRLSERAGTMKRISDDSLSTMRAYSWPGNVRELQGVVDTGFCLSQGALIEPEHFETALEPGLGADLGAPPEPIGPRPVTAPLSDPYLRMVDGGETFWSVVYDPFMDREINRSEVRDIIARGLRESVGSYKRLLTLFRIEPDEYLKFMDFLRHHRLKPTR